MRYDAVCPEPSVSIGIFYSIHWICKRTNKAKIGMRMRIPILALVVCMVIRALFLPTVAYGITILNFTFVLIFCICQYTGWRVINTKKSMKGRRSKHSLLMNEWKNEWVNEWMNESLFFTFVRGRSDDVGSCSNDNNNNHKCSPKKH